MSNGAGIAIAKLAPDANTRLGDGLMLRVTAGPFSIPAASVSILGPSVILHGLWDFPLFMAHKGSAAIEQYCVDSNQPPDECWRNDFANALNMEVLVGLFMSFIFLICIPICSFFVCWRRVKLLRAIESADLVALSQVRTTLAPMSTIPQPPQPRLPLPASLALWSRADVTNWLSSAGLTQYIDAFKPVNGAILLTLTDSDLQELGINVAVHRRAVTQLIEEDGPRIVPRHEMVHGEIQSS